MKLIIINGPCGVGKSSISERLHKIMPLSFLLNIDDQRRFFSGYRENSEKSMVATFSVSEEIIKKCLDMGHDVIIDKMLYDQQVLNLFCDIAKQKHAQVAEIILWATKDIVMERANTRGWKPGGSLTQELCEVFWHKIDEVKDNRPNAIVIDVTNLSEEETYAKVKNIVYSVKA